MSKLNVVAITLIVSQLGLLTSAQLACQECTELFGYECNITAGQRCRTYSNTVSCIDKQCQCNLGEDAVFNEKSQECQSVEDAPCLVHPTRLGPKNCVSGGECVPSMEGHNVGTCKCLPDNQPEDGGRVCIPFAEDVIDDDSGAGLIAVNGFTTALFLGAIALLRAL